MRLAVKLATSFLGRILTSHIQHNLVRSVCLPHSGEGKGSFTCRMSQEIACLSKATSLMLAAHASGMPSIYEDKASKDVIPAMQGRRFPMLFPYLSQPEG